MGGTGTVLLVMKASCYVSIPMGHVTICHNHGSHGFDLAWFDKQTPFPISKKAVIE